jgi:hypothetical protein
LVTLELGADFIGAREHYRAAAAPWPVNGASGNLSPQAVAVGPRSRMNRRDVLRRGVVLPALTLAPGPLLTAIAKAAQATLSLERFVFDVRFAESAAIGEQISKLGVRVAPVADDLMTLWFDELDLAWREKPMALAGVTLADAFFVLETFALDRGMHVVYRGEHGLVENGRIKHRVAGPAALVDRLTPLASPWESALATALTRCPLGAPPTARAELVSEGAALSLRDVPLHSWIIAPRTAVSSRVES